MFYRADDPGTEYAMGGNVVERIMPTAFDAALAQDDVRALFDHDSAKVLGRTTAGTLRLSTDERGLRYEIDPPDTQTARDLIESIRRGDVSGSSFCFRMRGYQFREEPGKPTVLEQTDVQLIDVGPVTFPAYSGASAGVRADGSDSCVAEIVGQLAARDRDALAVTLAEWDADLGGEG